MVGSTFRLCLPTGPLTEVRLVHPSGIHSSSTAAPPKPAKDTLSCRVLAVDDRRDNQMLVSELLQKAGAEVMLADGGRVALEMVAQADAAGTPFDIVLMDMQMPDIDGYEATRSLCAAGHRMPIIALTASAMQGDHRKCLEVGCDGYITKPVDARILVATIRRYLAFPPAE